MKRTRSVRTFGDAAVRRAADQPRGSMSERRPDPKPVSARDQEPMTSPAPITPTHPTAPARPKPESLHSAVRRVALRAPPDRHARRGLLARLRRWIREQLKKA